MSSSESESSYQSEPKRGASPPSSVVAQAKSSVASRIEVRYRDVIIQVLLLPTITQKRREQNRISQRAVRERQEQYRKRLEEQIAHWQQKLQLLTRSYSQQTEEVARLKAQIEQLNNVVSQFLGVATLGGSPRPSQQEFDLVPLFDADALSPQRMKTFW
jgi:hypothetical protein